ncbi:ectoine/hydroxyectoine ABC transporter permease subunit EhuD [Actinocatenispora thailandica]|nr:ectoine/hydroxyectoine ABC transporter permease subunit EhuD [Actinocatenispora thailandica]
MFDTSNLGEILPLLLVGFFRYTLTATLIGTGIGVVFGLVLAILRRMHTRWVRVPVRAFVEFVRSTPLMVQLLFATGVGFVARPLGPFLVGSIVLGIHYATYMSEVYRAGIDGVPKGQWEAAVALSMSRRRTWQAVVLPQAVRNVLPALGNYAISMFKDTPYLSVIAVPEMVRVAEEYGGEHFAYTGTFTLAAILFLLASYPTSILVRKLETRLGH